MLFPNRLCHFIDKYRPAGCFVTCEAEANIATRNPILLLRLRRAKTHIYSSLRSLLSLDLLLLSES